MIIEMIVMAILTSVMKINELNYRYYKIKLEIIDNSLEDGGDGI